MEQIIREIRTRNPEETTRWVNEMLAGAKQETPEGHQKRQLLAKLLSELARTPPTLLDPQLHDVQRLALSILSQKEAIDRGDFPQELVARWRKIHDEIITEVLVHHPSLQAMQFKIDRLIEKNSDIGRFKFDSRRFSLPALINSCAKHLSRPQPFTLWDYYTPSDAELRTQLLELHIQSPRLHTQVMKILINASLHHSAPHPAGCSCVLCTHMASLMAASATATSSASASGSTA